MLFIDFSKTDLYSILGILLFIQLAENPYSNFTATASTLFWLGLMDYLKNGGIKEISDQ